MNRSFVFAAIFLLIFAVVLGALWFFQGNKTVDKKSGPDGLTKTSGSTEPGKAQVNVTLATKENQSEIGAAPYNLDKQYVFYVEANTHTINITDTDMKKASVLIADGKTIKTTRWTKIMENVGHHLNGFLIFDKKRDAKKLTLTIKEFGGVPKRTFAWSL